MVQREGLETTLKKLGEAGVYVTIDEYKGRKPIERSGLSFQTKPEDFDNPRVNSSLETQSSGTRGSPAQIKLDLDFMTFRSADYGVQFDALGLYRVPYAIWNAHLRHLLCAAKTGMPLVKWFVPLSSSKNKLASSYTIQVARFMGYPLPWPERIGPHEARKIAEWIENKKQTIPRIVIWTPPSPAMRVCSAAREYRLDISGTHFICNGEPLTLAREQEIKAAGCRVVAIYSSSETGCIASGCINSTGDDAHLLKGHVAVIQVLRKVGSTGMTFNAFQVTSLLPPSPKVFINMENGDYGQMETRACGCKFDSLGLTTHLSHICSYEKLTSESMTFFAGDLARIVEETLPARFGGSPLDYQVVEEEEKNGISHLNFLVSPKLGEINEKALIQTVFDELKKNGGSSRMMAAIWQEAGTVQVKREDPQPTKAGKVFPFQVQAG